MTPTNTGGRLSDAVRLYFKKTEDSSVGNDDSSMIIQQNMMILPLKNERKMNEK